MKQSDDVIVIDLSEENIGSDEPKKKDWRDFPNRERNTMIIALTEGDILVDGETYRHVAEGEIYIYADGAIDESKGELAEVSIDGVQTAMTTGKQIFNIEDVG
jgi:hypothetical protein